ncbi:hypothetical protein G5I_14233 [Acromyrmex echinatior]|uniref:Uncharacterized protein n=1 Tax=Acromyrmex echinatior TaxID=103372 RepID=F4X795_ACREC|nr:hypothetical protein G5I_14233 [Acromyrmex echinatior]
MRTTVHQHDRDYRNSNETMVADGLGKRVEGGDSMERDETTLTTHRYAAQPVQSSTSTIDYREISNTYVNDTQSIGADHSTPDRETGRCDTYTQTPKARRRASLIHFLSFRPDDAPSRTNRGDDLAGAARILHSDAKLRELKKNIQVPYLAKCPLDPASASRGPTLEISLSSHVATAMLSRVGTQQWPVRNFAIKKEKTRSGAEVTRVVVRTKLGRAKAEATARVEDSSRTDDMRAQTVLKQKSLPIELTKTTEYIFLKRQNETNSGVLAVVNIRFES